MVEGKREEERAVRVSAADQHYRTVFSYRTSDVIGGMIVRYGLAGRLQREESIAELRAAVENTLGLVDRVHDEEQRDTFRHYAFSIASRFVLSDLQTSALRSLAPHLERYMGRVVEKNRSKDRPLALLARDVDAQVLRSGVVSLDQFADMVRTSGL